jgi:hypothetical protein
MKDKLDLMLIEQRRILKYLTALKFDENKTTGEIAAIQYKPFKTIKK